MRGVFITNRYYDDGGMQYVYERLRAEFEPLGVTLDRRACPIAATEPIDLGPVDFVVFWDKDVAACRLLERRYKVFNGARAVAVCDDKVSTYLALGEQPYLIPSLYAPVCYDVNDGEDDELISRVEALGYPVVVKESVGSQGRQVYLAKNRSELIEIRSLLRHKPHLYQQYVGDRKGEDVRYYVAGGKVVGACKRVNTTSFASNVAQGGRCESVAIREEEAAIALQVADRLGMFFGSVDFIRGKTGPYLVEVNSNAYFKGIESLGINVAGAYARAIKEAASV